jgi:hypothetical protein
MVVQGSNGREQLKAAAEAANEARKQVVTAINQARGAWRQVVAEAHRREESRARSPRSAREPRRPSRSSGDFAVTTRRTRRVPSDDDRT